MGDLMVPDQVREKVDELIRDLEKARNDRHDFALDRAKAITERDELRDLVKQLHEKLEAAQGSVNALRYGQQVQRARIKQLELALRDLLAANEGELDTEEGQQAGLAAEERARDALTPPNQAQLERIAAAHPGLPPEPLTTPAPDPIKCARCGTECHDFRQEKGERICILCVRGAALEEAVTAGRQAAADWDMDTDHHDCDTSAQAFERGVLSLKSSAPPKLLEWWECECGNPDCAGVTDYLNHQCGGPHEACAIPGCPECGAPPAVEAEAALTEPMHHDSRGNVRHPVSECEANGCPPVETILKRGGQ